MPIFKLVDRFRSPNAYKKNSHTEVSPKRQPVLHYRCWRGDRHYLVSKHLSHLSTGKNPLKCFYHILLQDVLKFRYGLSYMNFVSYFCLPVNEINKEYIMSSYMYISVKRLAWPGVLYSLVCTNSHSIINSYGRHGRQISPQLWTNLKDWFIKHICNLCYFQFRRQHKLKESQRFTLFQTNTVL